MILIRLCVPACDHDVPSHLAIPPTAVERAQRGGAVEDAVVRAGRMDRSAGNNAEGAAREADPQAVERSVN